MNGVPIEEKYLTPEDFEEQLLTVIMKETQVKAQQHVGFSFSSFKK